MESDTKMTNTNVFSMLILGNPNSCSASSTQIPDGIRFHLIEIYLEELEKTVDVAQSGEVPTAHILQPMFHLLGRTINGKVFKMVAEEVFEAILKKTGEHRPE